MVIYLFVFFVCIVSTAIAERSANKRNKLMLVIFSAVAILAPSVVAGCRDSGIGTDTLIYADEIWYQMKYIQSFDDLLRSYEQGEWASVEPVYLLINFVATFFGDKVQWAYFFTNLTVVTLIYLSVYDNRKQAPMWLGMAIFCFIYYNMSMNLIRQSIALAICVYSIKFFERKDWLRLFICLLLMMNAHNTGVFFCGFILFSVVFLYMKHGAKRNTLLITIFGGILLIFLIYDALLVMAVSWGIVPVKYLMYISEDSRSGIGKSNLMTCLYFLMVLYMGLRIVSKKRMNGFLILVSKYYVFGKCLGTIILLTSSISLWAFRLSYYFNMAIDLLFVPRAIYQLRTRSKSLYIVMSVITVCFCMVMWYWLIILRGEHATFPYKSKILDF